MAALNSSTEFTFDRLTKVLQRGTRQDVQRIAQRNKFTKVEDTALMYALDALHVEEGDEEGACDVFDRWLDLSLFEDARTPREFALVDYADVCVECALH